MDLVFVLTSHHSTHPHPLANGTERWKVPASDAAFGNNKIEAVLDIEVIYRSLEAAACEFGILLMLTVGRSNYKPLNAINDKEQCPQFL